MKSLEEMREWLNKLLWFLSIERQKSSGNCLAITIGDYEESMIRAILAALANQSGAVSPDTKVSPHGETGGAVMDVATWAERIHADANLGVMHVQHLLEELLREAGVAGKGEKCEHEKK